MTPVLHPGSGSLAFSNFRASMERCSIDTLLSFTGQGFFWLFGRWSISPLAAHRRANTQNTELRTMACRSQSYRMGSITGNLADAAPHYGCSCANEIANRALLCLEWRWPLT